MLLVHPCKPILLVLNKFVDRLVNYLLVFNLLHFKHVGVAHAEVGEWGCLHVAVRELTVVEILFFFAVLVGLQEGEWINLSIFF